MASQAYGEHIRHAVARENSGKGRVARTGMKTGTRFTIRIGIALIVLVAGPSLQGAETRDRYFAHAAVEDRYGVIAPWYKGQNGQFDFRIRIAAETVKRYPWTTLDRAVAAAPEYVFNNTWRIASDGTITVPPIEDNWINAAQGQASARMIITLVEYYQYSGDPAAIAHITRTIDTLLDHSLTGPDHPWPHFLISVPVEGEAYGKANPAGWIQLDIVAEAGFAMLRAYQMTGVERWRDMAGHWANLFARKRNREAGAPPWGRYANPEEVRWGMTPTGNHLTGAVVYIVALFDELIRLGYTGVDDSYIEARDAGRAYLRDTLLPAWTVDETWGRSYWDWESPVQLQTVTDWVCRYLMDHKEYFPNWKHDVRNIMSLFLNRTSVSPRSRAEVYSGAWAFPESSGCCGSSLAWAPVEFAHVLGRYGVESDDEWARELARRMAIIGTYDVHETGVAEDDIDGGFIAAGGWFNGAVPSIMKWTLRTIGWFPEILGASRENHIVRTTATVNHVIYGKGRIRFSTFDAPERTQTTLRLAFEPRLVLGCDTPLLRRSELSRNGYTLRPVAGGDAVMTIRHDGCRNVVIEGDDPQEVIDSSELDYQGEWSVSRHPQDYLEEVRTSSETDAEVTLTFTGNQVRVVGRVSLEGGLADVYLNGVKQPAPIDFWSPEERHQQIVYYRNGLSNDRHTLRIVARGAANPVSEGRQVYIDAVQFSSAEGDSGFGEGGGPTETQRMIFGYTKRTDYRDSQGYLWRPGTEFVVRTGHLTDSVAKTWWTRQQAVFVEDTPDQTLYRYGAHWPEIVINVTVGPGEYYARLKFSENEHTEANRRAMTIFINGQKVAEDVDIFARAEGGKKAVDLVYNEIRPRNGMVEIRLQGQEVNGFQSEAMIQALEVGLGDGGPGATPAGSR